MDLALKKRDIKKDNLVKNIIFSIRQKSQQVLLG